MTSAFRWPLLAALAEGAGWATFAFLPAWATVLSLRSDEVHGVLVLVMVGTTVTAAAVGTAAHALLSRRGPWVRAAAVMLFLLVFAPDSAQVLYDSLRLAVLEHDVVARHKDLVRAALRIGAVAAVLAAAWQWRRLARLVHGAAFLSSVLFAVMTAQLALTAARPAHAAARPAPGHAAGVRNVVLVFDELDAELLEDEASRLPGFARLKAGARVAGPIYPPSNYTHLSIPAMLTATELLGTEVAGAELYVTDRAGTRRAISGMPHVFDTVTRAGGLVSVAGWAMPYCRVFREVDRCLDDSQFSVPGREVSLVEWAWGRNWLVYRLEDAWARRHAADTDRFADLFFRSSRNYVLRRLPRLLGALEDRLLEDVASGRHDLVFAHLPCPHLPRADGRPSEGMLADYTANLRRCDELVGRVLDAADRGPGGPVALYVTGDHWFRGRDWLENRAVHELPRAARPVPFFYTVLRAPADPAILGEANAVHLGEIWSLRPREPLAAEAVARSLTKGGRGWMFLDRF